MRNGESFMKIEYWDKILNKKREKGARIQEVRLKQLKLNHFSSGLIKEGEHLVILNKKIMVDPEIVKYLCFKEEVLFNSL